jgi:glycosyltransferase involved in cell wall biosynthesis
MNRSDAIAEPATPDSTLIGIHVEAEPERLKATLAHLRAATAEPVEILLLADGPDVATRRALEAYRDLRCSATDRPLGAAACFNRLLGSDAGLLIFLEAGALVGPGWLPALRAALAADPRNGLAGPSTNRSWNMQAIFPQCRELEVAATAELAASRFGAAWRSLEPLYCLADFCYAVRREVVDAIGGADETYGAGPCWEMDYSIRASRAGFRAVWAEGAFVYRQPASVRRLRNEVRLLALSKGRYQQKFCGLRLDGSRIVDSPHCRGDACRHFAPADRIEIRRPLDASLAAIPTVAVSASTVTTPLVSCIMPTRDRAPWLRQAIAYFQTQDYGAAELIIIDDSETDRRGDLPDDSRIRYFHSGKRLSIGAKRNRACELSRGDMIVHWDDDDWYAPGRLSAQVAPILSGNADITGLTDTCFFDLNHWAFWRCTPELYRRLFVHGVHGGTLAYRRRVFERLARFPDSSLAEDAAFLNTAMARGARLQAVTGDDLFLYLRHGTNAWSFGCGTHLDAPGWKRIGEPPMNASDRAFYAARSPVDSLPRTASLPLVSCIMPTYNRRSFVPLAIEYFFRQDYPNLELVILDDGDDKVTDLIPAAQSVRYIALDQRLRLGAKRNAAIEASHGEIILHWDDDDWSDRSRVSTQVSALLAADADICGNSQVWFCEIASGRLSVYRYPLHQNRWLYGASLCYRRTLWRRKPFEPIDIGEDTRFVWARPQGRMLDLASTRLMVAMVHPRNVSSPHPLSGPNWVSWSQHARTVLGDDWDFYQALAKQDLTHHSHRVFSA